MPDNQDRPAFVKMLRSQRQMARVILLATVTAIILGFACGPGWGQLLVSLVLLPLVVLGFQYAAAEFRKSNLRPNLDLSFDDDRKTLTLEPPGHAAMKMRLRLHNTGSAVGVWYAFNVEIPTVLAFKPSKGGIDITPVESSREHWRRGFVAEHSLHIIKFVSRGNLASYPDYPEDLADIMLYHDPARTYASSYRLPYTIVSDWGQRSEGELELRIVPRG